MSDRTPCCIVGCRRTTKHPYAEWICGKHWGLVPVAYKRVWSRVKRRHRRARDMRTWRAGCRIWERIKRHVQERAIGI